MTIPEIITELRIQDHPFVVIEQEHARALCEEVERLRKDNTAKTNALQALLEWSQSGTGWQHGPIYQSQINHIASIIEPVLTP